MRWSLCFALAAGWLWTGCSDNAASPRAQAVSPAKAATKPVAVGDIPELPPPAYAYNPVGKRDPFRSPSEDLRQSDKEDGSACDEPLCQFNLDQLTLVAVVTGSASPVAMVEDPSGQGFMVRRNTKIGKQGGKVTNILRDTIIVTEFWQRPDSKERVANPVTMSLRSDPKQDANLDLISGKLVE